MNKMNLMAKPGQSQAKLDALMDLIFDEIYSGKPSEVTGKVSTGYEGCRYEKTVEQLVSAKGIRCELVTASGKVDLIIYIPNPLTGKKQRVRIEIKTGTGIVAMLPTELGMRSINDYGPADLLPGADLVIYAARASEFEDIDDLLDESIVMKPIEWAEFMIANSGKRAKGFGTAFKLAVNGRKLAELNRNLPPMVEVKDPTTGEMVMMATSRECIDRKTGETKVTRRGCPRYTNCIVIQESYKEQIAEAIEANLETRQVKTLGEWLEEIGRA